MTATNYTVTSVEPWDRRPLHPTVAKTRGLAENYEDVVVISGYSTGGAIHHPIQSGGKFYRPFAIHRSRNYNEVTVTGKDGSITKHENVIRMKRVKSPDAGKWVEGAITLDIQNPAGGKITQTKITDAVSWNLGDDPNTPAGMTFFSVKAVAYTDKEAAQHTKHKVTHEYQIPTGSKKQAQPR